MAYPLATLAPSLTTAGITPVSYEDILASLKASAQQIYGDDVYLEADSQDGQLLAIVAQAIYDAGQVAVAVWNSFSPQTAYGVGLSNVVKINHISRAIATASQVNVALGGVAGTTIVNGKVGDTSGNQWLLPASVTIPPAGTITVTATAEQLGAIQASAGTVTKILTPTAGWQTVTNASSASPGQPVETDAELRQRQVISPAKNAVSVLTGLAAAIKALPGVTYGTIYENDTNSTDGAGLPAHSIAVVVAGGDAAQIAQTIYDRKAPGVTTYGSTTVGVTDISGAVRDIKFSVPTEIAIKVEVSLYAGVGYNTAIATDIKNTLAAFVNALSIGEDVIVTRLMVPAMLGGAQDNETYRISTVKAALAPSGTPGTSDIAITLTQKATLLASDVTIVVL